MRSLWKVGVRLMINADQDVNHKWWEEHSYPLSHRIDIQKSDIVHIGSMALFDPIHKYYLFDILLGHTLAGISLKLTANRDEANSLSNWSSHWVRVNRRSMIVQSKHIGRSRAEFTSKDTRQQEVKKTFSTLSVLLLPEVTSMVPLLSQNGMVV